MLLTNILFKSACRPMGRQFLKLIRTQSNQLLGNYSIRDTCLSKTNEQKSKLFIKRCYSSQADPQQQQQEQEKPNRLPPLVDDDIHLVPNFFVAIKSSFFLHGVLRAKLDNEFSMIDFVDASKQACEVVSSYLSQENYEALEGMVSNDAIQKLRHTLSRLSPEQKQLIPINKEDIYGYFPYRINVVYEGEGDNQRTFAEITEVFYILKGLQELQKQNILPPLTMGLMPEYQEKIFVCNLKFRRDYTDGTDAPWIMDMYNQFSLISLNNS